MSNNYDSTSYAPPPSAELPIFQDDTRIFHREAFRYATVNAVTAIGSHARGVQLEVALSDGSSAWLGVLVTAPSVLRLLFGRSAFDPPALGDYPMLVSGPAFGSAPFGVENNDHGLQLRFGAYVLEVGLKPFLLRVHDAGGALVFELETEQIAGMPMTPALGYRAGRKREEEPFFSWRIHNGERFFGLGEKWNKVEKSSTRATIWNTDTCGSNTCDLAYKAVPVLHSTAGFSLLLHTGCRSFWEIGTFSYTSGSVLSEAPTLDLLLFLSGSLKEAIRTYTSLTGVAERPPRWALGIWMSRCAYPSSASVEAVLERLRRERIPCDVVHLDPLWMKNHYYFQIGVDACDFEWNADAWPDPVDMLAAWRARGVATCFWVNPYLPESHAIYAEAREQGFLVRSVRGGIARLAYGEPVGMLDFSNPSAKLWWKNQLKALIASGASVFKPDYGDRVPEDALFFNGRTGREMHHLYLHLYTEAAWEAVREATGDALVWRRPGYIGTHRFAGTWAGDTQVSWEAMAACLRGGLCAGFTAEAFWGHDIGGFVGEKPSPELYIRWSQWGLLSPLSRFHGTTPREPWEYGETALAVVRHYAELRYRLVPYLETLVDEACRSGLPILRHLALEFPDDPAATHIDDQYLLGPDLLVAPVFSEGARFRKVYVPEGSWRLWDDPEQKFHGPGFFLVPAPLERIPLLVRSGARIPMFVSAPEHLKGALPEVLSVAY